MQSGGEGKGKKTEKNRAVEDNIIIPSFEIRFEPGNYPSNHQVVRERRRSLKGGSRRGRTIGGTKEAAREA